MYSINWLAGLTTVGLQRWQETGWPLGSSVSLDDVNGLVHFVDTQIRSASNWGCFFEFLFGTSLKIWV